MASSSISDPSSNRNNEESGGGGSGSENAESKSMTIVINEDGEIFYDQQVMQSIIDSNQSSTKVTFVRVGDDTGDPDQLPQEEFVSQDTETLDVTSQNNEPQVVSTVIDADPSLESLIVGDPSVETGASSSAPATTASNSNPILMLDQDQISCLENVLQSAEAKGMLGEVLVPMDSEHGPDDPEASLVDLISGGAGGVSSSSVHDVMDEVDLDEMGNSVEDTVESEVSSPSSRRNPQKRRSQRQMDKEMKEEAERIRMENQALMKKEIEEAKKKDNPNSSSNKDETKSEVATKSAAVVTPAGRPKRERKIPAHLKSGDFESAFVDKVVKTKLKTNEVKKQEQKKPENSEQIKKEEEVKKSDDEDKEKEEVAPAESDDDDDDENSGDWNSEDDPERLWCICKQPHNNRFMICCDTCLDWYHGKCVGITKKMGKEMEETGNEWRCPTCKKKEEQVKEDRVKDELNKKLKEREDIKQKGKANNVARSRHKAPNKTSQTSANKIHSDSRSIISPEKQKQKEKSCFNCDKPPQVGSIYCSSDCILKHVAKAKTGFKNTNKSSKEAENNKKSVPVMVMDPKSNTILNGPNAPTLDNLQDWMLRHPTFHVVMQTLDPTAQFYGHAKKTTPNKGPKIIPPHKNADAKSKEEVDKRLAEYKQSALSSLSAARDKQRNISGGGAEHHKRSESQRHKETSKVEWYPKPKSHSTKESSSSTSSRKVSSSAVKGEISAPPPAPKDDKPVRENAIKLLGEALKLRMNNAADISIEEEKLHSLVKKIEEELFRLYNKDVGHKYKNKYRSLLFNIKDEKNNGLFRKILTGKITPKILVNMSPEELARKELQEWRQAELKHDIDKIKEFELDQIVHGNKVVIKSHKGEEIVETGASKKSTKDLKLPDDIKPEKKSSDDPFASWGIKTWEHGDHEFESNCDVCNEKRTMDELVLAKMEREKIQKNKEERRKKEKERRKSKDHHHHHRHHRHHSSSSSNKDKVKEKERHVSSSKDKDREHKHSSKSSSLSSSSSHKRNHDHDKNRDEKSHHHSKKTEEDSKKAKLEVSKNKGEIKKDEVEKKNIQNINKEEEEEELKRQQSVSEKLDKAEKMLAEFKKSQETLDPPGENLPEATGEEEEDEELLDDNRALTPPPPATLGRLLDKNSIEEVSSTVTIATPDNNDATFDESPKVWNGIIDMPDVAQFSVSAHGVSGTTDYLTMDLKETLKIVGRIGPNTVWDYISQLADTPTKEILVLRLQAATKDEEAKYNSFYNYLDKRKRFGVVGHNGKMVKDCYILPLASDDNIHACLRPFNGPGLEEHRPNMLLALIVRSKRKRPTENKNQYHEITLKKSTTGTTKSSSSHGSKSEKSKKRAHDRNSKDEKEDEIMYDPQSAGTNLNLEEEEEEYDPESAFDDENLDGPGLQKKPKLESTAGGPITSSDTGGFTEQLAKLAKEIEKRKAEIASMTHNKNDSLAVDDDLPHEDSIANPNGPAFVTDIGKQSLTSASIGPAAVKGFSGLPSSISSILFGGKNDPNTLGEQHPSTSSNNKSSSSGHLSSMTDADLLAKVQEMEDGGGSVSDYPTSQHQHQQQEFPGHVPFQQQQPFQNYDQQQRTNWNNEIPTGLPQMPRPPMPSMSGGPPSNFGQRGPPGPWIQGFEPPRGPPAWQQNQQQGFHSNYRGNDEDRWHQNNYRGQQPHNQEYGDRPFHRGGGGGRWRGGRDKNRRFNNRGSRDGDNNRKRYDKRDREYNRRDNFNSRRESRNEQGENVEQIELPPQEDQAASATPTFDE